MLDTTLVCEPVIQSVKNCCIPFHLLVKWLKHQQRPPSKYIAKKEFVVLTECVVRSSGSEKKHLTGLSSATAYGQMLPPMIIFRGKSDRTICNLIISPDFIVKIHKKAWIGYDLLKIWVEEIWLKHTQAACKRPGFHNAMLSLHAFAAHLIDGVKIQLLEGNSNIFAVPASSTLKCQHMDVCLNKQFKAILRKC